MIGEADKIRTSTIVHECNNYKYIMSTSKNVLDYTSTLYSDPNPGTGTAVRIIQIQYIGWIKTTMLTEGILLSVFPLNI